MSDSVHSRSSSGGKTTRCADTFLPVGGKDEASAASTAGNTGSINININLDVDGGKPNATTTTTTTTTTSTTVHNTEGSVAHDAKTRPQSYAYGYDLRYAGSDDKSSSAIHTGSRYNYMERDSSGKSNYSSFSSILASVSNARHDKNARRRLFKRFRWYSHSVGRTCGSGLPSRVRKFYLLIVVSCIVFILMSFSLRKDGTDVGNNVVDVVTPVSDTVNAIALSEANIPPIVEDSKIENKKVDSTESVDTPEKGLSPKAKKIVPATDEKKQESDLQAIEIDKNNMSAYMRSLKYLPEFVQDERTIPRNIFQTSKDQKDVSTGNFREFNPKYYAHMFNNEELDDIVKNNFPKKVYDIFSTFPKPVLKADFFRYAVLYLFGGIYSDTDTVCHAPFDSWIPVDKRADIIVGIENDQAQDHLWVLTSYSRQFQFLQWTLLSRPFHPIMGIVIDRIIQMTPRMIRMYNIRKEAVRYMMVLDWTGPGVYTDAVLDYISGNDIGNPTNYYEDNSYASDEEFDREMTKLEEEFKNMKGKDSVDRPDFNDFERRATRIYEEMILIKSKIDKKFIKKLHEDTKDEQPVFYNNVMIAPRYFLSPGIHSTRPVEVEISESKVQHLFGGSWKGYEKDENNFFEDSQTEVVVVEEVVIVGGKEILVE